MNDFIFRFLAFATLSIMIHPILMSTWISQYFVLTINGFGEYLSSRLFPVTKIPRNKKALLLIPHSRVWTGQALGP